MIATPLTQIAEAIGARVVGDVGGLVATDATQDTRPGKPAAGALFFALVGEATDGHAYVADALARGAVAAVVARPVAGCGPKLVVADPLMALAELSRWYARRLAVPIVAITGSVGKTTVRTMLAGIFDVAGGALVAEGNFNTEIGVPLTVLRADEGTKRMVLEFAMRGPGQIAHLAHAAPPAVGAITNIGITHAELLGGPDGIARAKGELIEALPADGVAVLPVESDYFPMLAGLARCPVMGFGLAQGEVTASYEPQDGGRRMRLVLSTTSDGYAELAMKGFGEHLALDAACAAATALACGVFLTDIAEGLERFEPAPGRGRALTAPSGATILDDAYNACPASVHAALGGLARREGRRIAVLGDMLELGPYAEDGHRGVGRAAAEAGLAELLCVGPLARWIAEGAVAAGMDAERVTCLPDGPAAADAVAGRFRTGDIVLVKASHGIALEVVVDRLMERDNGLH
jgi:UDP-N-acetylmuramoyl-tripeptide--D-alanyl-D-alanine ligase